MNRTETPQNLTPAQVQALRQALSQASEEPTVLAGWYRGQTGQGAQITGEGPGEPATLAVGTVLRAFAAWQLAPEHARSATSARRPVQGWSVDLGFAVQLACINRHHPEPYRPVLTRFDAVWRAAHGPSTARLERAVTDLVRACGNQNAVPSMALLADDLVPVARAVHQGARWPDEQARERHRVLTRWRRNSSQWKETFRA